VVPGGHVHVARNEGTTPEVQLVLHFVDPNDNLFIPEPALADATSADRRRQRPPRSEGRLSNTPTPPEMLTITNFNDGTGARAGASRSCDGEPAFGNASCARHVPPPSAVTRPCLAIGRSRPQRLNAV
jgi:hypothetical protein